MINKEFLENLKVGDEIIVRGNNYFLDKISRITPTGQIKTEGGLVFKKGYCARGASYFIVEKTEENIKSFITQRKKSELKSLIRDLIVDALELEKIEKIIKCIKDEE